MHLLHTTRDGDQMFIGQMAEKHLKATINLYLCKAEQGLAIGTSQVDGVSVMISIALQYGVPWVKIRDKFRHVRFGTPDEKNKSLLDGLVQVVDHLILVRKKSLDKSQPQG